MSDDERSRARDGALRLLARREHARVELARKLRSKGHAAEDVDAVLDELVERDWLSDERFAEEYVRSRITRGFGPLRITAGLRERGVSEACASLALEGAEVSWLDECRRAREAKFGAATPGGRSEWGRQARFLAQRGFPESQIRKVLDGRRQDH